MSNSPYIKHASGPRRGRDSAVISVDTKKKELVDDSATLAAVIARKAIRKRSGGHDL